MNIERLKELRERLAQTPTFATSHNALLGRYPYQVVISVHVNENDAEYTKSALNALRQDLLTALDEQAQSNQDFDLKAFGAAWVERE